MNVREVKTKRFVFRQDKTMSVHNFGISCLFKQFTKRELFYREGERGEREREEREERESKAYR